MKTLNEWMDSNGISPEQAAEIFGKSVGTIRNWRSAGVPNNQQEWVAKRMVDWTGTPLPTGPDRVTLEVEPQTFDQWNRAAMTEGKLLREWAIDVLNEAAEADDSTGSDEASHPLYHLPQVPGLKAAEPTDED